MPLCWKDIHLQSSGAPVVGIEWAPTYWRSLCAYRFEAVMCTRSYRLSHNICGLMCRKYWIKITPNAFSFFPPEENENLQSACKQREWVRRCPVKLLKSSNGPAHTSTCLHPPHVPREYTFISRELRFDFNIYKLANFSSLLRHSLAIRARIDFSFSVGHSLQLCWCLLRLFVQLFGTYCIHFVFVWLKSLIFICLLLYSNIKYFLLLLQVCIQKVRN